MGSGKVGTGEMQEWLCGKITGNDFNAGMEAELGSDKFGRKSPADRACAENAGVNVEQFHGTWVVEVVVLVDENFCLGNDGF